MHAAEFLAAGSVAPYEPGLITDANLSHLNSGPED